MNKLAQYSNTDAPTPFPIYPNVQTVVAQYVRTVHRIQYVGYVTSMWPNCNLAVKLVVRLSGSQEVPASNPTQKASGNFVVMEVWRYQFVNFVSACPIRIPKLEVS